ncbi:hypothetical protein [Spongorhabdus nitratireducens]
MANRGSYPHPVIDNSDDVSSSFEVINPCAALTQEDIEITYEIRTEDADLIQLIESGYAIHSLNWRCSSAISTGEIEPRLKQRTPTGFKFSTSLDQQDLKGKFHVDIRVIVAKEVKGHYWANQHPDYEGARFDLKPGDVLAYGGRISFMAEKLYDPLNPPVGSCFEFVSSRHHKGIKVDLHGNETVKVRIPEKIIGQFSLFSNQPDLQISLVVLPALIQTLSFIKSNRSELLDDYAWYVALNKQVETRGGWDQDEIELAQKILENPIDRFMLEKPVS